jgi:hypothetical protein
MRKSGNRFFAKIVRRQNIKSVMRFNQIASCFRVWTIGKAVGVGVTAAIVAFILWPLYAAWQEILFWPFVAALTLMAFSGISILLISVVDMISHRRGKSIRPVRIFDMVLGTGLLAPSFIQLRALLSF